MLAPHSVNSTCHSRVYGGPAPGAPTCALVTLVTSPPSSQLSCVSSLAVVQGCPRVTLNQSGLECDVAASGWDAEPLPGCGDRPAPRVADACPFGERPEHPWAVGPEPSEPGGGALRAAMIGPRAADAERSMEGALCRGVSEQPVPRGRQPLIEGRRRLKQGLTLRDAAIRVCFQGRGARQPVSECSRRTLPAGAGGRWGEGLEEGRPQLHSWKGACGR